MTSLPMSEKWDQRYRQQLADGYRPEPVAVLTANAHWLPPAPAAALDLACGLGANAQWLAARGFAVMATDISPVAIAHLQEVAARHSYAITAQVSDVTQSPLPAASYLVIVVSQFLERALFPRLCHALAPGGMLFYQTYTRERPTCATGPANPAYLLAPNELLHLCSPLVVRYYQEPGLGVPHGFVCPAGCAQIVAQKP